MQNVFSHRLQGLTLHVSQQLQLGHRGITQLGMDGRTLNGHGSVLAAAVLIPRDVPKPNLVELKQGPTFRPARLLDPAMCQFGNSCLSDPDLLSKRGLGVAVREEVLND
jgi:hypothetical protein